MSRLASMYERIDNPKQVTSGAIRRSLLAGKLPTIQFSKPGYPPTLLRAINALCVVFGDALEVRFFGHYNEGFDAAVLKHLQDVQNLSVDCLTEIRNIDALYDLQKLRKLSFGVYEFADPSFLGNVTLDNVTDLRLGENKNRNFDLMPLAAATKLRFLSIEGHKKLAAALADHPCIEKLTLRSSKRTDSFEFLNSLTALQSLSVILGGRDNLNELKHKGLKALEVIRVRGLNDLSCLSALPSLECLRLEDQSQLSTINFTNCANLQQVLLLNCKRLAKLEGLGKMNALSHLRLARTALDLDALLAQDMPRSLKVFAFYDTSEKRNAAVREKLDALGYREYS